MKPRREILLKIALSCLGVAAAVGVLAALTGPNDVVWRIIGSMLVTALAAGTLARLDARFPEDGFEWRLVLAASVFFYAVAMMAVWDIWIDTRIWLTVLIAVGGALGVFGSWRSARRPEFAAAGTIMAGAVAAAAPVWLAAVWRSSGTLAVTGMLVLGWSAAASACAGGPKLFATARWRWIGIAAAALGYALCEGLQRTGGSQEYVARLAFAAGFAAGAVVHANLCRLAPRPPGWDWLLRAGIGLGTALAALATLLVLIPRLPDSLAPLLTRVTLALSIATSAATIALAALAVFERRKQREGETSTLPTNGSALAPAAAGAAAALALECPGCGAPRRAPPGRSACPRCGVALEWRVVA